MQRNFVPARRDLKSTSVLYSPFPSRQVQPAVQITLLTFTRTESTQSRCLSGSDQGPAPDDKARLRLLRRSPDAWDFLAGLGAHAKLTGVARIAVSSECEWRPSFMGPLGAEKPRRWIESNEQPSSVYLFDRPVPPVQYGSPSVTNVKCGESKSNLNQTRDRRMSLLILASSFQRTCP